MVIKDNRLEEENYNNQGCLMKIVIYNNALDIVVEFQDSYKERVSTNYDNFLNGKVKNQYYPSVFGVGMIGSEYPSKVNGKMTKEYTTWRNMLMRCFDVKYKEAHPAYKNVTCCDEWLLFENFYEWLHSQENFDKWFDGKYWALDKDIIIKGNKIYSPNVCCLVPANVNVLFTQKPKRNLPVGIYKNGNGYTARCDNLLIGKTEKLGTHQTVENAFNAYKIYKEDLIKEIAKIEYSNGNIIESCYKSMMLYVVEIND